MLQHFLIEQPIWHLDEPDPQLRWEMGVVEDDPTEDNNRDHMPRKGVAIRHERRQQPGMCDQPEKANWVPLPRPTLVANVLADDPLAAVRPWHRVVLVSGAGLGKTANLKWLCAQVNHHDQGRGRMLAIFAHLRDLPNNLEKMPDFVYDWLVMHLNQHDPARLHETAVRLLKQGRVLFLLDSLDEAGAWENSPAVAGLRALVTGRWAQNPVWISGRPYAFRATERFLCEMVPADHWTFVRIGPLNEPEARQLVENENSTAPAAR